MDFAKKLLSWYNTNKRELPWRNSNDPYRIWISEIILQQTRIKQGIDYYNRFIEQFPTLESLARAPLEEVLKLWQGLGYYSRARNLHIAANQILNNYSGEFPDSFNFLMKLKGVGQYTAAAIASIAFNEPVPVVDGNVYRFLSRYFGMDTPIDTNQGKKEYHSLAGQILYHKDPGTFNQAIMEFGSVQCRPVNPECRICVFNASCRAFQMGRVQKLPVKARRIKMKNRYFHYIVPLSGGYTYIGQRTEKDIWHSLYEFPLVETSDLVTIEELMTSVEWKDLLKDHSVTLRSVSELFQHQLTHQKILARFINIECNEALSLPEYRFKKIKINELSRYPVSRLTEKFLLSDYFLKQ